jgi:hypothetical protein
LHQLGAEQFGNLAIPPATNKVSRDSLIHSHPEGRTFGGAEFGRERLLKTNAPAIDLG